MVCKTISLSDSRLSFSCVDHEDLSRLESAAVNKTLSLCGISVLVLHPYNFEAPLFNSVIKGFTDCKNVRLSMK